MSSVLNNLPIKTKFIIIFGVFLTVSLFSIWGMAEIATANHLQKMERDHIEFSTLLQFHARKYVRLMKEGSDNSRSLAYEMLNARSDNSQEMGILQLTEEMVKLQQGVFIVTSKTERTLFRWFGFGMAFDIAASGPPDMYALQKLLEQLDRKIIPLEKFEKKFLDGIASINERSSRFAPIVNEAALFVRDLMIILNIVLSFVSGLLLIFIFMPIIISIKYFTDVSKIIADGDLNKEITIDQKDEIGKLAQAFRGMQHQIKDVAKEINTLTLQIREGRLDTRGKSDAFDGGWRELIHGINNLIEAFVSPIYVTAQYVDRISKGDIPEKITEAYKGDFNKIRKNLNQCIDVVNGLVAETVMLTESAVNGRLGTRGNPEKFGGDYARIVSGINNTLDSVIRPLNVAAAYVNRISKGDFPEKITDEYKGDFNEIINNLNILISNLRGTVDVAEKVAGGDLSVEVNVLSEKDVLGKSLSTMVSNIRNILEEISSLTQAALEGDLDNRGSAEKFEGEYARIVREVNKTLDAVISPLKMAAGYVNQISKGNIPDKISEQYKGDFNEIRQNINHLIDVVNGLVAETVMLTKSAVAGKLDTRGDAEKFGGDYACIVKGINDTLDAVIGPLKMAAGYVDQISRGDIPEEITQAYKGNFNEIRNNINIMIKNLNQFAISVQTAAKQVSSGSEQLSTSAEEMAHGANQQAATVEEISGSMEEMNSTVEQNADNARETSQIAMKAALDAQEGGKAVAETVQAMKHISDKISIIEDIARQTNMLALNAAIEAARAGENGKGFAVVASEVRKLAERSQTAAKEIGLLSVSSVEIAEKAGRLFEEIAPGIRKTAELVQEISASGKEQAGGIAQVNNAVQQLDQVIQQNVVGTEQMASTSQSFSSQAEHLLHIASFFKVSKLSYASIPRLSTSQKSSNMNMNHAELEKHLPGLFTEEGAEGGFVLDIDGPNDSEFQRY
ncbi:methyl-accepting chemotaxis protein [Desulfonema magnum]|uniref:Methyl-accepting chemotaxis protein signailling domain-containing protein, HAMP domain-containing n=1 Tax=Desulfonema magnum TaxID=45655 RepID=A0A975GPB6_9BACT|nr:methyl-accepting chemotaxis protein [Desulfonema magnum]QTA88664.1 Methyl-accepting chemotaxis protein signailling domain-containing protein, HAMP domain-containing [Desulfonema magnum]